MFFFYHQILDFLEVINALNVCSKLWSRYNDVSSLNFFDCFQFEILQKLIFKGFCGGEFFFVAKTKLDTGYIIL